MSGPRLNPIESNERLHPARRCKSGGDVRLRRATDADSPAVTTLIRGVLREFRLRFDPKTIDRTLSVLDAHFRRPGRRFWVLEDRQRIIGCVAIDRRSRGTAELMKMYLAPRFRGRGLGGRMLRAALAFARRAGYRRVMLETNTRFRAAAALYAGAGFHLRATKRIPPRCDSIYDMDIVDRVDDAIGNRAGREPRPSAA